MQKITAIIERGNNGTYDIHLGENNPLSFGLLGQGQTVVEAKEDFLFNIEEMKVVFEDQGRVFPLFEILYQYDIASFLQTINSKISLAGLENITGVHQKQLGHYLSGHRKPSPKTVLKIETGIRNFQEELSSIRFL